MTRITNFRYKRTHVEAGFSADVDADASPGSTSQTAQIPAQDPPAEQSSSSAQLPPKKKRKRSRSKKNIDTAAVKENSTAQDGEPGTGATAATDPAERTPRQKRRDREKWEKERRKQAKEAKEAARKNSQPYRLKAIADRNSGTICFACRETGHAARDCSTTRNAAKGDPDAPGAVVGICYRCGSSQHTLSRCKERVDPEDPMPFASCFVCSGKGHLASSCPQNGERGVYPNGGSCKLCGKTTHLARDCDVHKKVDVVKHSILGVVDGADEDDFHAFKRRKHEVDKEEKGSAHLTNGALRKPKKVVNF
ncbi:Zinc finger CCHC domain-containing protein 9 [Pleurotus pulmonarius]